MEHVERKYDQIDRYTVRPNSNGESGLSEHLSFAPVATQALHKTNEDGVCQYCGRLEEEIKSGYFMCTGYQGFYFKDGQYCNVPRHPLYLDCIKEIRNCGRCQNMRWGFCKKHRELSQFLESDSKYEQRMKEAAIQSSASVSERREI